MFCPESPVRTVAGSLLSSSSESQSSSRFLYSTSAPSSLDEDEDAEIILLTRDPPAPRTNFGTGGLFPLTFFPFLIGVVVAPFLLSLPIVCVACAVLKILYLKSDNYY